MPTINPKWTLILTIALAILGFLAGASSQFTDMGLSEHWVKFILAWFTLVLGIGNAANSVLIAFGMTATSKLANAAAIPGVQKIITTEAIANSSGLADVDKVVSK